MASKPKKRSRDSLDGIKLRGLIWYEDFSIPGYPRFRGCLRTHDRATAVTLVAAKRSALHLGTYAQQKPTVTLDDAIGRHWEEQQQYWNTAQQTVSRNKLLLQHLGRTTQVHTLTYGELATFVAKRRASGVSNGTVNRDLGHLRQIINACKAWGYRVPDPEIPFSRVRGAQLLLPEPEKRPAALAESQEEALFAAMRPDFHPVMRFGLMTGLRRENAFGLRWDQVNEETGRIELAVKSKKPGRKAFRVGLTPALKALLSRERGNHDVYVFTWLCHLTQRLADGTRYEEGQRYPLIYRGGNFDGHWDRARRAIGMPDLRFHDLRHTFASNLVASGVPMPVVQKAMGHADIRTTMIYDHTGDDAVMAARQALEQRQVLRVVGDRRVVTGTSDNAPVNDSLTAQERGDAQEMHRDAGHGEKRDGTSDT